MNAPPELVDVLAPWCRADQNVADLPFLNPQSPVHPVNTHPNYTSWIEQVRTDLKERVRFNDGQGPLPEHAQLAQRGVLDHLQAYVRPKSLETEYFYVLDFQGPGSMEYVKFGVARDLIRRVRQHCDAATPHGAALMNAWASTPFAVADARLVEKAVLSTVGRIYSKTFFERAYGVSYGAALCIARGIIEELRQERSDLFTYLLNGYAPYWVKPFEPGRKLE